MSSQKNEQPVFTPIPEKESCFTVVQIMISVTSKGINQLVFNEEKK
jgi:hypothetical protein